MKKLRKITSLILALAFAVSFAPMFAATPAIAEEGQAWADIPGLASSSRNVRVLAASNSQHAMAIDENGGLWSWGNNLSGQLGNGTNINNNEPIRIQTGTKFKSISVGGSHTLAIDENGGLWAWGSNGSGRLGDGTSIDRRSPVRVREDLAFRSVSAGTAHTLAIDTSGGLWAWGNGARGRLGIGLAGNRHSPVRIKGDLAFASVSAGGSHTLAIDENGGLWAWGNNANGQTGDRTPEDRTYPVRIKADTKFMSVAAGTDHSAAIDENGGLWVWGCSERGALGNGIAELTINRTPMRLMNDVSFRHISAGDHHTLAIDENGGLWAWGNNARGRIGDGATTNRLFPVRVKADMKFASASSAGHDSGSFAIDEDGGLWAWGGNVSGQVGDGTNIDRHTPVQIFPIVPPCLDCEQQPCVCSPPPPCPTCNLHPCQCEPDLPPEGCCIDYSHPDLIVHTTTEGSNAAINLTRETIDLSGFTVAAFSINGGQSWRNIPSNAARNPFDPDRFHRLLNRPLNLRLSDQPLGGRPRTLPENANIIAFPQITGRALRERLIPNFRIAADDTGATPGQWVLATRTPRGTPPLLRKDGIEIGVAALRANNRPDRFVNNLGFGRFFPGETNGICVLPLPEGDRPRPTRTAYFFRTSPTQNEDGTYTAASRQRRINITGQRRAPNFRVRERSATSRREASATITVRAGTLAALPDQKPNLHTRETRVIDVLDVTGRIELWVAATDRRAASARQVITLVT